MMKADKQQSTMSKDKQQSTRQSTIMWRDRSGRTPLRLLIDDTLNELRTLDLIYTLVCSFPSKSNIKQLLVGVNPPITISCPKAHNKPPDTKAHNKPPDTNIIKYIRRKRPYAAPDRPGQRRDLNRPVPWWMVKK
jgi:hypothetical protein